LIGNYWHSESNRKKFFDDFAKKKRFDPLVAANWYCVTREEIEAEKVHTFTNYLLPTYTDIVITLLFLPIIFANITEWRFYASVLLGIFCC
jgi:hypothetical protein